MRKQDHSESYDLPGDQKNCYIHMGQRQSGLKNEERNGLAAGSVQLIESWHRYSVLMQNE